MSKCVEKLPHSCGTSDGLQVFSKDGKVDGYCFACSTYVPDPYGDGPIPVLSEKEEDSSEKLEEIHNYPSMTVVSRKLNKATLDHFGVKVGTSYSNNTSPEVMYFPYYNNEELTGYKAKLLEPKKFWGIGTTKKCDMFGWKQALASGSPRIYITEGEIDALTVWQVLTKKNKGTPYEVNVPAVVSLRNGASGAANEITSKSVHLRRFKEVILVFDQDKMGSLATEEVMKVFPSAKTVAFPGKDPNDALMQGFEKGLTNALVFQAESPKNTKVVTLDSLVNQALKPVEMGLDWPFPALTRYTRGLRFGETYYFGAGVKMGKSDLANTFVAHFAVAHELPVYIANMEETNVKSTKKILGKVSGKIFHDPNIEFKSEDLVEAAKQIENKVFFVDAYQHITWDYLQQDIHNVVNNQGVKLVLIDPITNLTNHLIASETDSALRGIAQDLAAMARDLDIAIFIFCHCRAPVSGPAHERGGNILSHQFTGSRAMARSCNYMVGLEGNKDPELSIEERNTRKLVILEDREYGETGTIPLYWNHVNHQFVEMEVQ